jgi:minor extracellular serine protease Vpr
LLKKYSEIDDHGTSTSTIAGGSGYGSHNNNLYRGIAYDCDFVLVNKGFDYLENRGMSNTRLIDAINYIFSYAESVGKPSVINSSLGGWTGPRDGTSLFAQACDNLSGPGKILVFAAGNNGLDKLHLEKNFTEIDTVVSTIVTMPLKENYFEVWGEVNKTFCIEIGLFAKGVLGAKTQKFCVDGEVHSTFLIGKDNDTSFITISSNVNVLNNKPVLITEIIHKTKDSLYLSVIGNSGTIHVFDEEWGQFIGNGSWAIEGDSRYTISELACAKSIITVSAFASKLKFKNLQNQSPIIPNTIAKNNGELALFSSIGPTLDGRMKPDIAAPGCVVVSATNSYSPTFRQGGQSYYASVAKYLSPKNNRTYYYTAQTGTSVAAPIVTGIVALLLQINPKLTPKNIKEILSKTAKKDEFTSQIPDSTRWGAGKIDGYAAIKETIITTGTVNVPKNEMDVRLFPNPNHGQFTIEFDSDKDGYFLVEVTNVIGIQISQKTWELKSGKNYLQVELNTKNKGLNLVTITGFGGQITKKIVLN